MSEFTLIVLTSFVGKNDGHHIQPVRFYSRAEEADDVEVLRVKYNDLAVISNTEEFVLSMILGIEDCLKIQQLFLNLSKSKTYVR